MRVAVINDTSGPHAGCQLVMEAIRAQLDRVGVELLGTVPKKLKKVDKYPDFVRRADLLIVNGEGSIHHGKRGELIELAARFPAILFNCVYQDNPPSDALRAFRFVAARESMSAGALRAHGAAAEVIPDVMLTAPTLVNARPEAPAGDLGVTDNVTDPEAGFTALVGEGRAAAYIDEIAGYRRLCVGRFHGVMIAAALGVPFSAWPSNTHKTEGAMADMGASHLFGRTLEAALALTPAEAPESIATYISRGRRRIDQFFEQLEDLA